MTEFTPHTSPYFSSCLKGMNCVVKFSRFPSFLRRHFKSHRRDSRPPQPTSNQNPSTEHPLHRQPQWGGTTQSIGLSPTLTQHPNNTGYSQRITLHSTILITFTSVFINLLTIHSLFSNHSPHNFHSFDLQPNYPILPFQRHISEETVKELTQKTFCRN